MIVELLRSRYSVRKFQDRPIPEDVVQTILDAGRLSPSGGNEQPWLFGVITDRELIAGVAELAYRQEWIAKAPLLIVLCAVGVDDRRGGRDIQKMRYPEHAATIDAMDRDFYLALNQEEHQTKIAGTHMVLAAWERGIGSCWISRFRVRSLADLLGLRDGCLPSEILAFGYPEGEFRISRKKSMDEVVFRNHYDGDK